MDPKDDRAGVKFLGPETLRGTGGAVSVRVCARARCTDLRVRAGVGGILLGARGERFVNELATRDEVTAAIWRHCGGDGAVGDGGVRLGAVAHVVLTPAAVEAFGASMFKFYHATKKFFVAVEGADGLARALGGAATVEQVTATLRAYASAARAGEDEFGKTVFPADFAGAETGTLYMARVTPAIHYTMGTGAARARRAGAR